MVSNKLPPRRSAAKFNLVDGDTPSETAAEGPAEMSILKRNPADLRHGTGLDAGLQSQIGHKLKAMYDEVAQAPIPDKFLALLQKLDGKDEVK